MSRDVKYDYDHIAFHAFRHAARQSGPEEKYAFQSLTYKGFEIGVFSDGISRALGRLAEQSYGVKNLVSTRFFTLPKHAGALQCVGIVNEKFVKTISR